MLSKPQFTLCSPFPFTDALLDDETSSLYGDGSSGMEPNSPRGLNMSGPTPGPPHGNHLVQDPAQDNLVTFSVCFNRSKLAISFTFVSTL